MNATTIRAIEGFVIVLVSAFLTQFTVGGAPIDLSTHESQAAVGSALLSALVIAFRQAWATRGTSS